MAAGTVGMGRAQPDTLQPAMVLAEAAGVVLGRGAEAVRLTFPDLQLEPGAQVAMVGPSGSGKTTFLQLLAGLRTADSGRVEVDGQDLAALSEAARDRFRAGRVGYVSQDLHLIEGYSAMENLVLALGLAGVPPRRRGELARSALQRLDLGHRLRHPPARLSTGERQRVAIARAVAHGPRLLLADEPTAHLDRARAVEALAWLRRTADEMRAVLLVATHDPWVVDGFERVIEVGA